MDRPEPAPEGGRVRRRRLDQLGGRPSRREQGVERALGRDHLLPERNGLGEHGYPEPLGLRPLGFGQDEGIGEFDHVERAGVAVDLGRPGEAEAGARPETGGLVGAQPGGDVRPAPPAVVVVLGGRSWSE